MKIDDLTFPLGHYPRHLGKPWQQLAYLHDEDVYRRLLQLAHVYPTTLPPARKINWLKTHPSMLYHFFWEVIEEPKYLSYIYVRFTELQDAILYKLSVDDPNSKGYK